MFLVAKTCDAVTHPALALVPIFAGPRHFDEVVGETSQLERERFVKATVQPPIIFVRMEQHRLPVMNGPDGFIAVGHDARINCPPAMEIIQRLPITGIFDLLDDVKSAGLLKPWQR